MTDFIPVNEPLLDGNEKKYLCECIDTGWISSEGPFVKTFEKKFSARVGRNFGVSVCNGSVALDLTITALGIGSGDEVIMPTFTIISCAAAIIRAGATPVLVDSDPVTWNMDVTQIESKITAKTKAIMVVHIYGLPVDMKSVLELAIKYNLKIIEDAAEAHGQTYSGKPCGSFGDVSVFSFYPNKHITTGEGGMVVANDEVLADKFRSMRNLCFQPQKRFVHDELGWNFRMSNIQAALGVAQLENLDRFVEIKRRMGRIYTECLSDQDGIQLPLNKTDYAENIFWVYGIILKDELSLDADVAMKLLAKEGIETRPFFYPMHLQPVLIRKGFFIGEHYPVAEKLAQKGFYVPSGLALSDAQIQRVCLSLKALLTERNS
jgi:perosamine synthetase